MYLSKIYNALNDVLNGKVFYGNNVYDNFENASMPYIVYQELSKRPASYSDDIPTFYKSDVQITLVTKNKNKELEEKLEQVLLNNGFAFSLISEFKNQDKSVNRVYEITMEVINYVSK